MNIFQVLYDLLVELKTWNVQSKQQHKEIMATIQDFIVAANTLSDKADGLITAVESAVAVLQSQDLSPEAQAAVAKLSAEAAKVDAEVTKLGSLTPPAPAPTPGPVPTPTVTQATAPKK